MLAFLRDLGEMIWEYNDYKDDLVLMEIQLLRLVEDHVYMFDDEPKLEILM
jgi:hypothetical protein